jgi:hypothetical protein
MAWCKGHPMVVAMAALAAKVKDKPIGPVLSRQWFAEGRAFESREAMEKSLWQLARDDEFEGGA